MKRVCLFFLLVFTFGIGFAESLRISETSPFWKMAEQEIGKDNSAFFIKDGYICETLEEAESLSVNFDLWEFKRGMELTDAGNYRFYIVFSVVSKDNPEKVVLSIIFQNRGKAFLYYIASPTKKRVYSDNLRQIEKTEDKYLTADNAVKYLSNGDFIASRMYDCPKLKDAEELVGKYDNWRYYFSEQCPDYGKEKPLSYLVVFFTDKEDTSKEHGAIIFCLADSQVVTYFISLL